MMLDAHLHIQDMPGSDRDEALGMKRAISPVRLFCNSTSPEDWDDVRRIAEDNGTVVPFFGIHPWYASKVAGGWEERLSDLLEKLPAGIGETGLDRSARGGEISLQKKIFIRQLEIAAEKQRVFTVHCVRAWGHVIDILKKIDRLPRSIIHSFAGPPEVMRSFLDKGAYISISLNSMVVAGDKAREILRYVPADRLLIETDHPYVREDVRGEEGYIACLEKAYDIASSLSGRNREELIKKVWDNGKVLSDGIIAGQGKGGKDT